MVFNIFDTNAQISIIFERVSLEDAFHHVRYSQERKLPRVNEYRLSK